MRGGPTTLPPLTTVGTSIGQAAGNHHMAHDTLTSGMGWHLTFRSAPTRTADLTHVVLLHDAVPNTDRLMTEVRHRGGG